ncbi:MAG: hypothetical protein ABI551_15120 [Polyangiaceae bacterium]
MSDPVERGERLLYGHLVGSYDDRGRIIELGYVIRGKSQGPRLRIDWKSETGAFDPRDGWSAEKYANGIVTKIVRGQLQGETSMPLGAWVAKSEERLRAKLTTTLLLESLIQDSQSDATSIDPARSLDEIARVRAIVGDVIGFSFGEAMCNTRLDPGSKGRASMRALFDRLVLDRRRGVWSPDYDGAMRRLAYKLARKSIYDDAFWRELFRPYFECFAEEMTSDADEEIAQRWKAIESLLENVRPLAIDDLLAEAMIQKCACAPILHALGTRLHADHVTLAIRALERAVACDPANASAQAALQTLYARHGEHEKACAIVVASARRPDDSEEPIARADLQAAIDRYSSLANAIYLHFIKHDSYVGAESEVEAAARLERRINLAWTTTNLASGAHRFKIGRIVRPERRPSSGYGATKETLSAPPKNSGMRSTNPSRAHASPRSPRPRST